MILTCMSPALDLPRRSADERRTHTDNGTTQRIEGGANGGTAGVLSCNCKKSRCLKL
jgi:hypothetical protein